MIVLDTQSVVMKFKITSASQRFKKPGNGSHWVVECKRM